MGLVGKRGGQEIENESPRRECDQPVLRSNVFKHLHSFLFGRVSISLLLVRSEREPSVPLVARDNQQNTDSNGALESRVATQKNKSTISSLVSARSMGVIQQHHATILCWDESKLAPGGLRANRNTRESGRNGEPTMGQRVKSEARRKAERSPTLLMRSCLAAARETLAETTASIRQPRCLPARAAGDWNRTPAPGCLRAARLDSPLLQWSYALACNLVQVSGEDPFLRFLRKARPT